MNTADNSDTMEKSGESEKGHLPGWDGVKVQVTIYEDLQLSEKINIVKI